MRRLTLPTPEPDTPPSTPAHAVAPARRAPVVTSRPWASHGILSDPTTARVLNAAWSGDPAVVVPSPPGAGKTRLVALLAAALCDGAEMRVGVAAQTREQAIEVARRVAALTGSSRLVWPSGKAKPDVPGVHIAQGPEVTFPPSGGGVVIATTARWLYSKPYALSCDLMIVDEAWQATYADVGGLGAFAAQIVCVGDPGQIAPVVTGSATRWQHRPSGPQVPAPIALLAAHDRVVTRAALRHTWRLGPATTALIAPTFYPDLPFSSKRPHEVISTPTGPDLPEIATLAVPTSGGPADPALIRACAARARALIGHTLTTADGTRPLDPDDLAVVCSHVAVAAAVRASLADLPTVLVGTANQLQGLERPAVIALHPLAGTREVTEFNADPGRACVMLSRHRAHLSLILDPTTRRLLDNTDPDLRGVGTHSALLDALP